MNLTDHAGADPGVGKGRGTNRLSLARWLEKIELASRLTLLPKAFSFAKTSREKL